MTTKTARGAAALLAAMATASPALGFGTVESISVRDDNGDPAGVDTFFTVNFEGNYLPNVVRRENGAASFEALKAQAVAARSFALYKLQSSSFIRNSTADQVYSLGGVQANPGGLWDLAVRETAGEVIGFNKVLTAAFYVAGARPSSPTYRAASGDSDPTATERWVTYPFLDGKLGGANTGTPLGFQGAAANRGAKSQNGADEQSDDGVHYYDILKFYYGGDIQLEQVIQSPQHTPFGVKPLASFERNNDYFNRSLTFAGQSQDLGTGTAVARSSAFARTGSFSQRLDFDYDAASDTSGDGFFSRHVSSVSRARRLTNVTTGTALTPAADPVGNVVLPAQGSIGFWLRVNPQDVAANAALQVSLAIDDFADPYAAITTEQANWIDVIADGTWRRYEWLLDAPVWTSAFGAGDGSVASRFSLDSILFRGLGDARVYLDDVFYDTAAVPEPTLAAMVAAGLLGAMRRRRNDKEAR